MIDLRLFRVPAFSASLAAYTLGILVLFGSFLFLYQYLQLVLGLSPFMAGVWTLPSFGAFIVGSMLAPVLVRRVRPGYVMAGGFAIAAVGLLYLTQVSADSGVDVLVGASVVYSLGLAPLFTLTNDLIIGTAPPERAGSASAISETGAELGGALSIAVLGTIGAAVYRSEVDDGLPASVPPDVAETTRDTLGGAVAASSDLTGALAEDVLEAARVAFTQGFRVVALVSAIVAAVSAVGVAVFLRDVRAPEPESPGGEAPSAAPVAESR